MTYRVYRGVRVLCCVVALAVTAGCVTVRIDRLASHGSSEPRPTRTLRAGAVQGEELGAKVHDTLLNSAYNPTWLRQCIKEAGGIDAVVRIRPISLATETGRQYLLEGKPPCAFGARMPLYWVIESSSDQVRLLADLGASDGVGLGRGRTNGYQDIVSTGVVGAGSEVCEQTWKFNGSQYDASADSIRCRRL